MFWLRRWGRRAAVEFEQRAVVARRGVRRLLLPSSLLLVVWGCASTDIVEPVDRRLPASVAEALLPPLEGSQQVLAAVDRASIGTAYDGLLQRGEVGTARATAAELLERLPTFVPAVTLRAQADFVDGRFDQVLTDLAEIVAPISEFTATEQELPASESGPGEQGSEGSEADPRTTSLWPAAELLYARSAERSGDLELAYERYRALAMTDSAVLESARPLVRSGASRLADEAYGLTAARFADAVGQRAESSAEEALDVMARWAPDRLETLQARRNFGEEFGRPAVELDALRQLAPRNQELRAYKRLAQLEVEVGDVERGLSLFEQMLESYPRDPEVIEGLASAQFRWRLTMLPESLSSIAAKSVVTRADFAELIYWLVPGVRSARPQAGRIATDVPVEHPQREAVLRIVNLGLMSFSDATLRRFSPDEPMLRRDALRSLLRLPGNLGLAAACTEGLDLGRRLDDQALCATAVACRVVEAQDLCRHTETLSGPAALEGLREILTLLDDPSVLG